MTPPIGYVAVGSYLVSRGILKRPKYFNYKDNMKEIVAKHGEKIFHVVGSDGKVYYYVKATDGDTLNLIYEFFREKQRCIYQDIKAVEQEVMPRPTEKIATPTKKKENVVKVVKTPADENVSNGWSDHTAEFLMKKFADFIEDLSRVPGAEQAAFAAKERLIRMRQDIQLAKLNTKIGVNVND